MKTIIVTIKSILKKVIVLTGFCCLFILPVSANTSNSEEGWNNPSADMSTVSSTSEKTVLAQTHSELKPFEEAEASHSQLLRAAPGGGTGQKEEVPVSEGIWAIIGLAIAYGVARRNRKIKEDTL